MISQSNKPCFRVFDRHEWPDIAPYGHNEPLSEDVIAIWPQPVSYPGDRVLPLAFAAARYCSYLAYLVKHFEHEDFLGLYLKECTFSKSFMGYCMYFAETIQCHLMLGYREPPTLDNPAQWMIDRYDVPGQDPEILASIDWNDVAAINELFPVRRAPRALVEPRVAPQEAVGPHAETLWPLTFCETQRIPTNTDWTPAPDLFAEPNDI